MPNKYLSPNGHPPSIAYSHLVKADRLLFISGQVGFREQQRLVQGGIEAQTRQALDNIGQLLAAGGAAWSDVVKLTIYLLDMTQMAVVRQVRGEIEAIAVLERCQGASTS